MSTAILLINLGTPDEANVPAVRRYLKQFLMDPCVVDIPWMIRYPLVNGVIIPKRVHDSTESYQQIWTEQGSPLTVEMRALTAQLSQEFETQEANNRPPVKKPIVRFCFRYGNPSTESVLRELKEIQVTRLIVMPLYPQNAMSSTASSLLELDRSLRALNWSPQKVIVPAFFDKSFFIDAWREVLRPLTKTKWDHVLFTYHGIPERHIRKQDCGAQCLKPSCCDRITASNQNCYKAQCYATTQSISQDFVNAGIPTSTSFQSRLGRTPWIQPYTDLVIEELARKNVKSLLLVSPAFTTDNLETLEELRVREKERFFNAGGQHLEVAPCLNHHPLWVSGLKNYLSSML